MYGDPLNDASWKVNIFLLPNGTSVLNMHTIFPMQLTRRPVTTKSSRHNKISEKKTVSKFFLWPRRADGWTNTDHDRNSLFI